MPISVIVPSTQIRISPYGRMMLSIPAASIDGVHDTHAGDYVIVIPDHELDRPSGKIILALDKSDMVGIKANHFAKKLVELDTRPGLYYVTAQQQSTAESIEEMKMALLGPFSRHADALLNLQRATLGALRHYAQADALGSRYGTSRLEIDEVAYAIAGDLNEVLLSEQEQRDLLTNAQAIEKYQS